jgi:hypothetical protein
MEFNDKTVKNSEVKVEWVYLNNIEKFTSEVQTITKIKKFISLSTKPIIPISYKPMETGSLAVIKLISISIIFKSKPSLFKSFNRHLKLNKKTEL